MDFFDENEDNLDLDIYNTDKADRMSLIDGIVEFENERILREVLDSLVSQGICKVANNGSLRWNLSNSDNIGNVYIDENCIFLPQIEHADDLIDNVDLLLGKSDKYIVKVVQISEDYFRVFHGENGDTVTEIEDLISLIRFFDMDEEEYFSNEDNQSDIMYDNIIQWFEGEE